MIVIYGSTSYYRFFRQRRQKHVVRGISNRQEREGATGEQAKVQRRGEDDAEEEDRESTAVRSAAAS